MSTVPPAPSQPSQPSEGGAPKSNTMKIACLVIAGIFLCGGVPVVGILAAIAVPNFMRFQCLSKQAEAKTNLAGLFTAQKAFYGEYGTYTSDLVSLNWSPDGQPTYVYGFYFPGPEVHLDNMPPDYDPQRSDTANPAVVSAGSGRYSTAKMVTSSGRVLDGEDLPEQSLVDRDSFVAGAVGDVDQDEDLDIWVMDNERNLFVLSNDCL